MTQPGADVGRTQPMPTTALPYLDAPGGSGHGDHRGVVPVAPARPPAPSRRRGGGVAVLMVVLALLAGLLIAGDRLGHTYAERTAAGELQTQLGLAGPPTVHLLGVPFLNQLVTAQFEHAVVDADQVPLSQAAGSASVDHLHLDLTAVHATDGFRRFEVGRADGWATLGWPAIVTLANGQNVRFDSLDPAGQGRVVVTVSQQVLGTQISAEIRATPQLDVATQTIGFTDPVITVLGIQLPESVSAALVRTALTAVPLALPLGLQADGLTVTADGARVELTGQDLVVGS